MTARHDRFVADVESAPIVDNAGHLTVVGGLEADRCPGCGDPIPGDVDQCGDCSYRCPACNGAGGWQQPDGLIVECPRGCMTGGDQ